MERKKKPHKTISFNTLDFSSTGNTIINFEEIIKGNYSKVTFDLRDLNFTCPAGLCYLVASIGYIGSNRSDIEIYIKFPSNINIHNYLDRMDFYKNINLEYESNINRNNCSDKLIEIQKIDIYSENTNEITENLINIFNKKLNGYDERIIETVGYAIGETIDNTIRHSNSPIGGWVCAQTYSDRLEICIIDCGIGIPQSLKNENNVHKDKVSEFKEDKEFIEYAIGKGITSKTEKDAGHSGEGLFFTTEFIKDSEGRIKIISGSGLLSIDKNNDVHISEIDGEWQGTIVMIELNLNKPISIKDIFDREFPEDSEDYGEDLEGLFL